MLSLFLILNCLALSAYASDMEDTLLSPEASSPEADTEEGSESNAIFPWLSDGFTWPNYHEPFFTIPLYTAPTMPDYNRPSSSSEGMTSVGVVLVVVVSLVWVGIFILIVFGVRHEKKKAEKTQKPKHKKHKKHGKHTKHTKHTKQATSAQNPSKPTSPSSNTPMMWVCEKCKQCKPWDYFYTKTLCTDCKDKESQSQNLAAKPTPPDAVPPRAVPHTSDSTFFCETCKKVLPIKYRYTDTVCADCQKEQPPRSHFAAKSTPPDAVPPRAVSHASDNTFFCEKCKKVLPIKYRYTDAVCADCQKNKAKPLWLSKDTGSPSDKEGGHMLKYPVIEVARYYQDVIHICDGKLYCNGREISLEKARSIEWGYYAYQARMDSDKGGCDYDTAYSRHGFEKTADGKWEYKAYRIDRYLHLIRDDASKVQSDDVPSGKNPSDMKFLEEKSCRCILCEPRTYSCSMGFEADYKEMYVYRTVTGEVSMVLKIYSEYNGRPAEGGRMEGYTFHKEIPIPPEEYDLPKEDLIKKYVHHFIR